MEIEEEEVDLFNNNKPIIFIINISVLLHMYTFNCYNNNNNNKNNNLIFVLVRKLLNFEILWSYSI